MQAAINARSLDSGAGAGMTKAAIVIPDVILSAASKKLPDCVGARSAFSEYI